MCVRQCLLRAACVIGGLASACVPSVSKASVFYSANFESGTSRPEWSSNQNYTIATNFTRFLGRYTNSAATLTVPQPARPNNDAPGPGGTTQLMLRFSLYIIDSWDGDETTHGPDRFIIRVNNEVIFSETFANQHPLQSYSGSPDVGPAHLGFDERWLDSIYTIAVPFDTASPTISVQFQGSGLHGSFNDESWGIDNVELSVVAVPVPGTAVVGMIGSLGLLRRRRR